MDLVKALSSQYMKEELPEMRVGDTVRVHVRIKEGSRERIQVFEGTIIARKNGGIGETITVRRVSYGVGCEKVFPVHSPRVASVETVRKGKVRRAKLYYLRERFGKAAKIELCVNDLMLHINRSIYETEHPTTRKESNALYDNIIQYIEAHLDEDLSLDELAKKFFVSKYHISHIFKENFGISIHQYITKKRLSMCKDAIISNDNITKVYLMFGFKDYTSFFRAFKKEFGISPKEYKELYTQKPQR